MSDLFSGIMDIEHIESAVESILFASGNAVGYSKLAQALELEEDYIREMTATFAERYNKRISGLMILCYESSCQLVTREIYINYIKKAMDNRRTMPISTAGMEVLSIVAYHQPVTRAYIDRIRGTDSSGPVMNLIEKDFIEECGQLDAPGRPNLYRVTENFMRCFGISSLDELPDIKKYTPVSAEEISEKTSEEISEETKSEDKLEDELNDENAEKIY